MTLMSTVSPRLDIPEVLNAATYFVDANLERGFGAKSAVICEGREYTYSQVAALVNQTGNAFRQAGLDIEQRVLLLMYDCPELVASFFGAMKIGAVAVPLNTLMKPHDYDYLLRDSRAKLLVVSQALLSTVEPLLQNQPYLKKVIVACERPDAPENAAFKQKGYLLFHDITAAASDQLEAAPTSKDDVAFWLYSSGTTGSPKGTVHLHHDMVFCAELYAKQILNITAKDRCYSVAKLFFAYGLGNGLYFPFAVGASTVLLPGQPRPQKIFELCAATRPTLYFGVPTSYADVLAYSQDKPECKLDSVRLAVSAGEPLSKSLWQRFMERFGVEILDGIGSTEILHIFISNRAGAVKPGSSGQVVPGYEARIVDEQSQEVAINEEGHLLIKGDSTTPYYWNKHEKTKQTIEGEWIRTGDKYHQDEDGYYWYHGRSDDMIKTGGIWVAPVEVESALMEHPAIKECAVVGYSESDNLTKPLAYVVLRDGFLASPDLEKELKQFVKDKLAVYKYPRWIRFVEAIPRTATGKMQRFKLREITNGLV